MTGVRRLPAWATILPLAALLGCASVTGTTGGDTLTIDGRDYGVRERVGANQSVEWVLSVDGASVRCLSPDAAGCRTALIQHSQFDL